MRRIAKSLLHRLLRAFAQRVLVRYHPRVVGITGSVGKTSTVQASALVAATRFRTRASTKNYNNEIGVPLSVMGLLSGGSSAARWAGVLGQAGRLAWGRRTDYPEMLVLELGADKPGDIRYLVEWLHPEAGIVTSVSATHVEYFGGVSAVAEEKAKLAASLPRDGVLILNADDPSVIGMRDRTAARVITYGFGPAAEVAGSNVSYACQLMPQPNAVCAGMQCQVRYRNETVELELPQVLGQQLVYPALAAIALGAGFGITLSQSARALRDFTPPPGRMRVISGIKGSVILDDSYNSSPQAAQAAVRVLALAPTMAGRRIAVLGDLRELGHLTTRAHRELGAQVARAKIGVLVCVGELARDIGRGAEQAEMSSERIFSFPDALSAGRFLQDRIRPNDVLLVKGSEAVRVERIVKELMAEPQRAGELLVRQGPEWR